MQTTATRGSTTASGYWTYPDAGTWKKRNTSGKQKRKKNAQTVRKSANDFLTAVFEPIHISEFSSVYSSENYIYLYNTAKNYAKLMGQELDLQPDVIDFEGLYKTFDKVLPKEDYLDIINDEDKLKFMIYDNSEEGLLYYIPCYVIDEAEGHLRDIYISFFSLFQTTQGLTSLVNNVVFEYTSEELPENVEEIDEDDDWIVLLNRYLNGDIADTLCSINKKSKYSISGLMQKIKKYKPKSERERKILELMHEGLKLFKSGNSILHYAYQPVTDDEDQEYNQVEMDRIILVVYDESDLVTENMFDWVSQEANENGYEFLSAGYLELTPDTNTLLKKDTYVKDFLNWINKFSYELCNT